MRARTKTAASEPLNFTVGELPSRLRLVVDATTSFTLRGTVVDDMGKPLAGKDVCPNVSLWFRNADGGWMVGYRATPVTVQTDAVGKSEIGGLWAGDKYDIQIDARGSKTFGSLKNLANLFAVSAPEKATRCVEAAVLRARSLDQPQRATRLAEMGASPSRGLLHAITLCCSASV